MQQQCLKNLAVSLIWRCCRDRQDGKAGNAEEEEAAELSKRVHVA
jgi:hypothetical protein